MATDAARLGHTRTGGQTHEAQAEARQDRSALERAWEEPRGLWGVLTTVRSWANGQRLVAVAFLFFLLGGIEAALMRIQLAQPNNTFLTPQQYDQLFTMHGSTMLFLFAVPFMQGAALMLLPLVLGAREVPWPRLTAFVFWTFTIGGLLLQSSWLFGAAPDAGWTAYAPLTEKAFSPDAGLDLWLLALMMVSLAGLVASAILIATVLNARAPGMSIDRMPLFGWAALVMSLAMFLAFVAILCGGAFMEFDRKFGTHFFDPYGGGSPLLWQYLFWVFGHPAVYIEFIPAAGIASMLLPALVRQRSIGYRLLVAALVVAGVVSFGLWMGQTSGLALSPVALALSVSASSLFAIAAATAVSAWLAMIWRGAGKWNTAYLFILGFVFLFILGVITGLMLSLGPFAAQLQGSFFVVGHLHYMLFGTVVFPIFAGLYYWFPKFKGRFLDERLGQWNFWLIFVGMNFAFFPMYLSGLLGMPRRVYAYPSIGELNVLNLISTAGGIITAVGVLVFIYNLVISLLRGQTATANPWGADSLEWATDSPVPAYGFRDIPIVESQHPLWDQDRLDAGGEQVHRLVRRLAEWPTTWRAALVTAPLTGEPREVYAVAGPSIWPLVAVIGVALVFVSFFFDQLVFLAVLLAGVIVLIAGLIGWHTPARAERPLTPSERNEFEEAHGVRIHPRGSPTIHLWSVLLTALAMATALVVMVACYLYYRSNSPAWPPDGMAQPDIYVPLIAAAVAAASELALLVGWWTARRNHEMMLRLGLGIAFLFGIAFLVLQVRSYVLPPLTPTTDAYGSIFYAIGLFMTLIAVTGLATLAGTQWVVWRGHYNQAAIAVRNVALFWSFVVVAWLAVLVTLYLTA